MLSDSSIPGKRIIQCYRKELSCQQEACRATLALMGTRSFRATGSFMTTVSFKAAEAFVKTRTSMATSPST